MWPIHLAFLLFILCRMFLSSLTPCNSFSFLTWSSASFFSSIFHNFSGISDLLSGISESRYHTKLCSKCSNVLVFSLNLNPICWWKEFSSSSYWMLLLPFQSWIMAVTVWQIPDAVDTVVCAPDDGWWYHPKHGELFPDRIDRVTLLLVGYVLE